MKYILDSNIISAILNGNQHVENKAREIISKEGDILLNGICYYEVKRGLLYAKAHTKLKKFEFLCHEFQLVWLDSHQVFDEAADIYVHLKRIGRLPNKNGLDIFIASITRLYDAILVTDNIKDFENVDGLAIENWIN